MSKARFASGCNLVNPPTVPRAKGISIEEGIRTHVFLSSSKETANINGKYYNNMELQKTNEESYNKELQDKLWKWSEEATGLKWNEVAL